VRKLIWTVRAIIHRLRIIKKFKNVLIHSSAALGNIDYISIGAGSSIMDNVILTTGTPSVLPSFCWKYEGHIIIGKGCRIRSSTTLTCTGGGDITIGDNVLINQHCILYGNVSLEIGANTLIAAHTIIVPNNHEFSDPDVLIKDQPVTGLGVVIGEDVWIGANVTVLDGVTIGGGAVVGASSVVTKSIPEYAIAVGNPARVIQARR
jgi:acetyltransferase-like isoleucine patch superfamily enzyme